MAKGDKEEDESTLVDGSTKQVECKAGTEEIMDVGPKEPVDPVMSHQTCLVSFQSPICLVFKFKHPFIAYYVDI